MSTRRAELAGQLFSTLDLDSDGSIDSNDLSNFIEDHEKLSEILSILDPEGSGKIQRSNFIKSFDIIMGDDEEEEEEGGGEGEGGEEGEEEGQQNEDTFVDLDTPSGSESSSTPAPATDAATAGGAAASPGAGGATVKHTKSVSFDPAALGAPTSPGGLTIPPAGSRRSGGGASSTRTLRPTSKKLQLKKGYASLKHSLILDELRRSPASASQLYDVTSPGAILSPTAVTPSASAAAAAAPAAPGALTPDPTHLPPPPSTRHTRQASSVDYSFTYSKSHCSLVERAKKILAWCEGAEGSEMIPDLPNATITIAEIETSIHYLARSLTPHEETIVLDLFQRHGVTSLPVQLFRDVLAACLEREEAAKTALLKKPKTIPTLGEDGQISIAMTPMSVTSPNSHLAALAAREFHPDAFVTGFIDTLDRKLAVADVKLLHPTPIYVSSSLLSPTGNSTSGTTNVGPPLSETESLILQLRTQLRQSDSEKVYQKQRYDFNLIFTKRLEAENFHLREEVSQGLEVQRRLEESLEESRSTLEIHRTLVTNLETSLAQQQQVIEQNREEYENLRVMIELEKKTKSKMTYEIERLQSSLSNVSQIRTESNKIYFREGLEEMRKSLGNLRYQRQLQTEVARIDLIKQEREELVDRLREANQTIAEQQRILNELQGSQLGKLGARASIVGIGGELRGPTAPSSSAEGVPHGVDVPAAAVAAPSLPRESLSDDLQPELEADSLHIAEGKISELNARLLQLSQNESQLVNRVKELDERLRTSEMKRIESESNVTKMNQRIVSTEQSMIDADARTQLIQQSLEDLRQELANRTSQHDEEMRSAEARHANEMAQIRSHAEAERATMAEQHQSALRTLQSDHDRSLATLRLSHTSELESSLQDERRRAGVTLESQLSDLRKEHALAHASVLSAHQSELSTLRVQLSSTHELLDGLKRTMSSDAAHHASEEELRIQREQQILTNLRTELTNTQHELHTTQSDLNHANTELITAASMYGELEKLNSDLKEQVSKLETTLHTSQTESIDWKTQLLASQTYTSELIKNAETNMRELGKLVDTWRGEAEKLKSEHTRQMEEAEERIKQLEKRNKELEGLIASHVCVAGGSVVVVGGGSIASPVSQSATVAASATSPSPMPANSDIIASGRLGGLGSPLTVVNPPKIASSFNAALPYSDEQLLEVRSYALFITQHLSSDSDLSHLFPLDISSLPPTTPSSSSSSSSGGVSPSSKDKKGWGLDLLRKLKDGLLLAKLINFVAPRTIDERVLNKRNNGTSLGWKAIVENLNVCITSAKSLGLTMRLPHSANEHAMGEIDSHTGSVKLSNGRRLSIGDGDDDDSETSSSSITSSSPISNNEPTNYIGIELGSSQIVLMSIDTSLEQVDIMLDFLFQLLKTRLVSSLFGPERLKMERLKSMLEMPLIDSNVRKSMIERTKSLQTSPDTGTTTTAAAASILSPKATSKISKFATLSRALPANLTTNEHKRFVTHFTTTILNDFDETSELSVMTPEQLLIRWINFQLLTHVHLHPNEVGALHFVAHLSDLDVVSYGTLIHRIDEWCLERGVTESKDGWYDHADAAPTSLLTYLSETLKIQHFHTGATITTQHQRLSLLLLALIFQKHPMLTVATTKSSIDDTPMTPKTAAVAARPNRLSFTIESGAIAAALHSASSSSSSGSTAFPILDGLTDEERESTLLKSFLNSSGIPHININHLFSDMRTGLVLLRFLDFLRPTSVDWKTVELNPNNKFKCIGNLNLFLSLAKDHLRLAFVNVGAVDLYSENNGKFILAVMWQLLRFHTLQRLHEVRARIRSDEPPSSSSSSSSSGELTDASILDWANAKVATKLHPITIAHHATSMTSFQDANIKNSIFLLNLLDNLQAGCVDWSQVERTDGMTTGHADPALLLRNASLTISIARKLGAELFALPQDIVYANKKVLLLIVGSLMAIEAIQEEEEQE